MTNKKSINHDITASEMGKMGGAGKHKVKLTKEFYSKIAKKRWEDNKKRLLEPVDVEYPIA